MLGANAPRILDTVIASCKENLQLNVKKNTKSGFHGTFSLNKGPIKFFFFMNPLPKFSAHLFKTINKFSFFKWNTAWLQAAATFVARLARSQSAMTKQPSTMTALKSKTKSLAKPKIRRKLQKINLTKEIRYIEANTATVVFLFFMAMTVNLKL